MLLLYIGSQVKKVDLWISSNIIEEKKLYLRVIHQLSFSKPNVTSFAVPKVKNKSNQKQIKLMKREITNFK